MTGQQWYPTGMTDRELSASLGAGQALAADVRRSMEGRHGRSLDHVRIHSDSPAAALCERLAAQAFAFGNHIAFAAGVYTPHTAAGERLLRHEVAHVLAPQPAKAGVFRQALCAGTCAPGMAPAFSVVSDPSFNCYAYAVNAPGSGFLQPGETAGTPEFTNLSSPIPAVRAAAAATYFTPAGMARNMEADLGPRLSSDCSSCCPATRRKIIAVTTDPMAAVGPPSWDFHWYRKDADRPWSHKRGELDSQRDDAAGASPICNPCTAARSYPGLNYRNVVGCWCV